MSVCELVIQWWTVQFLECPTEVFKMFKISPSEFEIMTMCRRMFHTVTEGVVRGLYKVLFIYLGFYIAFNTVQVISRWLVGRAEETSTCSSLGFCTVNCPPMVRNYQLSHLRLRQEWNPGLRGGRRECYHSASVAPYIRLYLFLGVLRRFQHCTGHITMASL